MSLFERRFVFNTRYAILHTHTHFIQLSWDFFCRHLDANFLRFAWIKCETLLVIISRHQPILLTTCRCTTMTVCLIKLRSQFIFWFWCLNSWCTFTQVQPFFCYCAEEKKNVIAKRIHYVTLILSSSLPGFCNLIHVTIWDMLFCICDAIFFMANTF